MKVYVAGGSSERLEVREWIARLRTAGIEVTYDWTDDPGFGRGCGELVSTYGEVFGCGHMRGPGPVLCSRCMSPLRIAETDRAAVDAADIVWWIVPRERSEGAAGEAGYALGRGKRLLVSGSRTNCPFRVFGTCFLSHEGAFEYLRLQCV